MLPKLLKNWLEWIFPVLLLGITVTLCALNYTPGTWLTGWDTLHPEFDFGLNFSREILGAWRGDQGLGAVAAHAHMSELPRLLILWLFHFVMPLSFVRYAYIFLCFIIGPLGVYVFVRSIFHKKEKDQKNSVIHRNILIANLAAFVSALVYIFNLATVQQFIVIFEMFAVQYASLGWLFWMSTKIIQNTVSRQSYFWLFILCMLSAPMAYASMLWVATTLSLGLYLLTLTVLQKKKVAWKKLFGLGLLTVAANSFWLLPNLYFLISPAHNIPINSHINRLFSQEAFIQNQEYGTWLDLALMRNFLFNWEVYDFHSKEFVLLLKPWLTHFQNPIVMGIGFFISLSALAGLMYGVIKKNRILLAFVLPLALTVFMLINANPPFSSFFDWLRTHSSLFEEGLRFPFTKFSFVYLLILSVCVGTVVESMLQSLKKYSRIFMITSIGLIISSVGALSYYCWPMFAGQLISANIRKDIPKEYFDLFSFMRTQPTEGRVALLPAFTSAGWQYQDWGYQGPGFIWFGMSQPVLTRDFDRWNPGNEAFYEQLSTAIYSEDPQTFREVTKQYHVQYYLVDNSTINPLPGDNQSSLHQPNIMQLLQKNEYQLIWQSGFLQLFETDVPSTVQAPTQFSYLSGQTMNMRKDQLFAESQGYVENTSSINNSTNTTYPFAFLQSTQPQQVNFFETTSPNLASVQMEAKIPTTNTPLQLVIPPLPTGSNYTTLAQLEFTPGQINIEFLAQNTVQIGDQTITLPQLPPISIAVPTQLKESLITIGETQIPLPVKTKKIVPLTVKTKDPITILVFDLSKQSTINITDQFGTQKMAECWRGTTQTAFSAITQTSSLIDIKYQDTSACQSLYLLDSKDQSYFAKVELPYLAAENTQPYACIVSKANNYLCPTPPKEVPHPQTAAWQVFTQNAIISPNDLYWLDIKAVNGVDPTSEQHISYRPPTITLYPLATFAEVPSSAWNVFDGYIPTPIKDPQASIKVNMLATKTNVMKSTEIQPYFQNCQPKKNGQVSEHIEMGKDIISAQNSAIACKAFPLPMIAQQSEHLLSISGENLSGRSLKLYMYNQASDHLDLEELLPAGNFSSTFSLPSWSTLTNSGYTLSVETRSFGRLPSSNAIRTLKLYTLPLDWVAGMKLTSPNTTPQIQDSLTVESNWEMTSFFSVIKIKNAGDSGLFTNNQSYDPGWIAFLTNKPYQFLKHVTVDGWENGWLSSQTGDQEIMILYWPQLLELIGLFLLIPMVFYLYFKSK